jgi:hypothetical protein
MLEITRETVLRIADDVELKSLPETDQYYAFNTSTGDHFTLNHTAFWVLNRLKQPTSFSDLESSYVETFNVRSALGAKHLKEVLAVSSENALIKEVML